MRINDLVSDIKRLVPEINSTEFINNMSIQRKSFIITGSEMKKESEYELPKNWQVKVTKDNREVVDYWLNNCDFEETKQSKPENLDYLIDILNKIK